MLRKEVNNRERSIQSGEKQVDEYRNRLVQYENQKAIMQKQIIRLNQEKGESKEGEIIRAELQRKVELVSAENKRMAEQSKYYEQQAEELQVIVQKLKNEQILSESKGNKLLPQINDLQKKVNDSEN